MVGLRCKAIIGFVVLGVFCTPAFADSALDLETLKNGDPWVQTSQDTTDPNQFAGQILIPAPASVVWEVLTDYDRLTDFMPGLLSSQVLERQGSQVKMEVRSVTQVFLAQIPSMAQLQMTEDPLSVLRFDLLAGDTLTQLSGRWLLDRPFPNQVLLSYEATAAVESVPRGMFARLFRAQLERDLAAIRAEALRRL
jgi:ribosome-associated toxin RatA of RatAB toxin-antitoxin module